MKRKIGEIFEFNGEWYQCVKSDGICNGCVGKFQPYSFCNGYNKCVGKIFKKLEKVGEPYEFDGHLFQSYRTFEVPIFTENYATVRELGNNSKISIEIKQNKEDMEDNKLNLKPFDLQKAKSGKPVCTRDGRKARIICFDRQHKSNIVALITDDNREYVCTYNSDGSFYECSTHKNDLMMLPEKKEMWINIYKEITGPFPGGRLYNTKEEAKSVIKYDKNYVTTAKVCWEG